MEIPCSFSQGSDAVNDYLFWDLGQSYHATSKYTRRRREVLLLLDPYKGVNGAGNRYSILPGDVLALTGSQIQNRS